MIDSNLDPILKELRGIEKTDVAQQRLSEFRVEDEFMVVAVEMLVEASCYNTVAASLYPQANAWSREEAAVAGNIVRAHKLLHGLLDQLCQRRGELAFILTRLIFETLLNARYLIMNFSKATITRYIESSLVHERKLKDFIQANVKLRSGVLLPIEDRMLKSVEYTAQKSGVWLEHVDPKSSRNWGGNVYQRCVDVGWREYYLLFFSSASSAVHGGWQDVAGNHLEWDETTNTFRNNLDWSVVRPQQPLAISRLVTQVAGEFFEFVADGALSKEITDFADDFWSRNMELSKAHEMYLCGKVWPEI